MKKLTKEEKHKQCVKEIRVISYNSTHIRYYDPVLGAEVKVTRKAFENSLSLQSNTMYTFSVQ